MVDSDNNSDNSSEDDPDEDEDEDDDSTFVSPIKGARAPVIRGTSIKSPTLANVGIRASNRRTQDAGSSDKATKTETTMKILKTMMIARTNPIYCKTRKTAM